MDREAKRRRRRRWNRRTTRGIERGQNRKRQISLQKMLRLPEGQPVPFKTGLKKYKELRRKVQKNQRMNRKRPRGVKRSLSKKDSRLYRKLVTWLISQTKRGQRSRYMKRRASVMRIAGPEEQLVRGLIRVAYRHPAHRENILELILDPEAGWEFGWTAQRTSSMD